MATDTADVHAQLSNLSHEIYRLHQQAGIDSETTTQSLGRVQSSIVTLIGEPSTVPFALSESGTGSDLRFSRAMDNAHANVVIAQHAPDSTAQVREALSVAHAYVGEAVAALHDHR